MNNCKVLFQGDSITDGKRGRGSDPNHILGHGYAFICAAFMGYKYPEKNYHFINKGVSGDTAGDLYARWPNDTLDLSPDIISILVGINDSAKEAKSEERFRCLRYKSTLKLILDQTTKILPNAKFILMEPFTLNTGNIEKEDYEKLYTLVKEKQREAKELSQEYNTEFVPLQKRFEQAIKSKPTDYWIWDSIHPTYNGHGLIANAWLEDTKQLFSL